MSIARPQLWRNLPVYQIYGANTDVGKTIVTTLLVKALKTFLPTDKLWYLKPVSTGPFQESDERFMRKYLGRNVSSKTLYQFQAPLSPHVAANVRVPDNDIILKLAFHIGRNASYGRGMMFVETAGGPLSPAPSGSTQADLYRHLRLPVILVADSKLGGISSTIAAFESLNSRGYDVAFLAIAIDPQTSKYQNYEYLHEYFRKLGIVVWGVQSPPAKSLDNNEDIQNVKAWIRSEVRSVSVESMVTALLTEHESRVKALDELPKTALGYIWWPFTQHKPLRRKDVTVIDSAYGDYFHTYNLNSRVTQAKVNDSSHQNEESLLRSTVDGSASWWTQGLGHGNQMLTMAAAYAAGRYGHVIFPEAIHEAAARLVRLLRRSIKRFPERVFFSDNGSTGMEVAVKMALRGACQRYGWDHRSQDIGIIGLQGSYHGDTIGSMDMSEPGTFNEKVEWYRGRGFWFEPPRIIMRKGDWTVEMPTSLQNELGPNKTFTSLKEIFAFRTRYAADHGREYETYIERTLKHLIQVEGRKFGALVMEPVVMGAGGMILVDPLFQRALIKVVRNNPNLFKSAEPLKTQDGPEAPEVSAAESDTTHSDWLGLPVIHDEVFTGLYRLGRMSSTDFLGLAPDIRVYAKLLTGGLIPLCVTAAKSSIFNAFASENKEDALLHGHSYTAHPVGCQVAITSITAFRKMAHNGHWATFQGDWSTIPPPRALSENTAKSTPVSEVESAVESMLRNAAEAAKRRSMGLPDEASSSPGKEPELHEEPISHSMSGYDNLEHSPGSVHAPGSVHGHAEQAPSGTDSRLEQSPPPVTEQPEESQAHIADLKRPTMSVHNSSEQKSTIAVPEQPSTPVDAEISRPPPPVNDEILQTPQSHDESSEFSEPESYEDGEQSSVLTEDINPDIAPWSFWSIDFVTRLSFADQVEGVWAVGTVLAISLRDETGAGYKSSAAKAVQQRLTARPQFNIHSRTLGNVIYFMCSLTSPVQDIRLWERIIGSAVGLKDSVSDGVIRSETGGEIQPIQDGEGDAKVEGEVDGDVESQVKDEKSVVDDVFDTRKFI